MLPPIIADNKQECGIVAAGTLLGYNMGNMLYKRTNNQMAKAYQNGNLTNYKITDKFINNSAKVLKQDVFRNAKAGEHRHELQAKCKEIELTAARAKANDKELRAHFQKMYDLGLDYIYGRKEILSEDKFLAQKGARAIKYGQKIDKRNKIIACSVLISAGLLTIKKIADNLTYKKQKTPNQKVDK